MVSVPGAFHLEQNDGGADQRVRFVRLETKAALSDDPRVELPAMDKEGCAEG
jgi:hypothetical protein